MRSYAAQDIVTLPTLNVASAIALGQQLLTAVRGQGKLPDLMASRAAALEKAHIALCQALASKHRAQPDPLRARASDQAVDQAFSALHDWLYGWCKLPTAEADQARVIHAALFPNGLKFTHLPYKQEWAEAKAKLDRITLDGFDKEIQRLGGQPLLDQARAAHHAYGETLGITLTMPDVGTVKLRELLLSFNRYLRAYVVAVTAHTDPDEPTSGALADALLAPLHKWVTYVTVPEEEEQETLPGVANAPAAPAPAAPGANTAPGASH